jgi:aquaporin Z
MKLFKKFIAELFGTFCLVLFACGVAAVTSISTTTTGATNIFANGATHEIATALAFGLVLAAMCYAIGGVSGCHINPAVSLAFLLKNLFLPKEKRDFGWKEFFVYVIAQNIGSFIACLLLFVILGDSNGFGANTIQPLIAGSKNAVLIACFVEIILTMVFVLVILAVTRSKKTSRISGVVIGSTLTLVHLVGIPFTGTSVNPARALWPDLFAKFIPELYGKTGNADALNQCWIYVVCPLIGAALAALLYWVFYMVKEKNDGVEVEEDFVVNNVTNNYYAPINNAPVAQPVEKKEEVKTEPVKEEPVEEKPVEEVKPEPEPVVAPVEETPEEKAVRNNIPFEQRVQEADQDLRDKYNELKEYCLSYDLHSRVSNDYDTMRLHRVRYVVMAIRGKTLKIHFRINPQHYADSTITVLDDSAKNKYEDVPTVFKVKSGLSLKRAKQIIDDVMAEAGINKLAEGAEHTKDDED